MIFNSGVHKTNFNFNNSIKKNSTIKINNVTQSVTKDYNPTQYNNNDTKEHFLNNDYKFGRDKVLKYSNIMEDGYTPQGFAEGDGNIFISAYTSGDDKSRLYVYDEETGDNIAIYELEHNAHAGGCAFDEERNLLFVTAEGGKVSVYDYSKLKPLVEQGKDNKQTIFIKNSFEEDPNESKENYIIYTPGLDAADQDSYAERVKASTMCVDGDYVYICQCIANGNGKMRIFKLSDVYEKDGDKYADVDEVTGRFIDTPASVQGMAVTEYKGEKYMVFSQSFGGVSALTVCRQNGDYSLSYVNSKYIKTSKIEGLTVDEYGNISVITEDKDSQYIYEYKLDEIINNEETIKAGLASEWQRFTGTYWQHGVMDDFYRIKNAFTGSESILTTFGTEAIPGAYSAIRHIGGATSDYIFSPLLNNRSLAVSEQNRQNYMDFVDDRADKMDNMIDKIEKHGGIGIIESKVDYYTEVAGDVSKLTYSALFTVFEYETDFLNLFGVETYSKEEIADALEYISEDVEQTVENIKEDVSDFADSVEDTLDWYGDMASDAWDATTSFVTDSAESFVSWLF